jgi:hypothetical protein
MVLSRNSRGRIEKRNHGKPQSEYQNLGPRLELKTSGYEAGVSPLDQDVPLKSIGIVRPSELQIDLHCF